MHLLINCLCSYITLFSPSFQSSLGMIKWSRKVRMIAGASPALVLASARGAAAQVWSTSAVEEPVPIRLLDCGRVWCNSSLRNNSINILPLKLTLEVIIWDHCYVSVLLFGNQKKQIHHRWASHRNPLMQGVVVLDVIHTEQLCNYCFLEMCPISKVSVKTE